MGGCASKPKESDILETAAVTESAVVESKNVEPETVSQEKADEVVAEKKEDVVETQKEAEPAKPAEAEPAKPAPEAVKTEAAIETVNETEPPKQEEAATAKDTKTNEELLGILSYSTSRSIELLVEVVAGTNPLEGAALGWQYSNLLQKVVLYSRCQLYIMFFIYFFLQDF